MSGRPRTVIGTFGEIHVQRIASGRYRASTRYRDVDGRLRRVARLPERTPKRQPPC